MKLLLIICTYFVFSTITQSSGNGEQGFRETIKNIILLNKFKNVLTFTDNLEYVVKQDCSLTTNMIFTKEEQKRELWQIINEQDSVLIAYIDNFDSSILTILAGSIARIKHIKIIIVQVPGQSNDKNYVALFEWAFTEYMMNILLITKIDQKYEIFTYEPFPTIQLRKITSFSTIPWFFERKLNLKGRELRAIFVLTPPAIFIYKDKNVERLSGIIGHTLMNFMKHINSRLVSVMDNKLISQVRFMETNIIKYTQLQKVDISTNFYMLLTFLAPGLQPSYPFRMGQQCFVIPTKKEISLHLYLILPFQPKVWIVIVISIFYLTFLLNLAWITKLKRSAFGESLSQVLSGIIFIGFPKDFMKQTNIRIRLMHLGIFLLGFVLSNMYLSMSTSFLSKTVYKREPKTLEELVEYGVKVMNQSFPKELNRNNDFKIPKNFDKILFDVDIKTFNEVRINLNREYEYAFLDKTDSWEIKIKQHRLLKIDKFRMTNICGRLYFLTLIMPQDSFLAEPLKLFMMRIQQGGLYDRWETFSYYDLIKMRHFKEVKEVDYGPKIIQSNHLIVVWCMWFVGLLISTICFMLEILRHFWVKHRVHSDQINK